MSTTPRTSAPSTDCPVDPAVRVTRSLLGYGVIAGRSTWSSRWRRR